MPRTTFTLLSKANHAPGPYTLPPTTMPANMQSARVYIDSTQGQTVQYSDPATHIILSWGTSTDGGQTYVWDGQPTDGGTVNRQGQPQDPEFTVYFPSPPDHGQMQITVLGGTIRFGVFADVDYL